MSLRDTHSQSDGAESEPISARESEYGYEIFESENDAAWISSDVTVPLDKLD